MHIFYEYFFKSHSSLRFPQMLFFNKPSFFEKIMRIFKFYGRNLFKILTYVMICVIIIK